MTAEYNELKKLTGPHQTIEMRQLHAHARTQGHAVQNRDTHRDRDADFNRNADISRNRERNEDMDIESIRRRHRERESAGRVSRCATTTPSPIKSFNFSSPIAVAALMSPVRVSTSGSPQQGVTSPELFTQGKQAGNCQELDPTYVHSHLDYSDGGVTSAPKVHRADMHTVSPATPIARTQQRTYMGPSSNVFGVITPSPIPFATSSPPDTLYTVQQSPYGLTSSYRQNPNRIESQCQNDFKYDPRGCATSGGIEKGGQSLYETSNLIKIKNLSRTGDCKSNPMRMQGELREIRDEAKGFTETALIKKSVAVGRNESTNIVSLSVPYFQRHSTNEDTDRVTDQHRLWDRSTSRGRHGHPAQKDTNRSTCSNMDMSLIDEVEAAVKLINAMVSA